MNIVNASEFVKAHFRWKWDAPEQADERASTTEAIAALFALTREWFEIVALEIRLGIYDRETLTEASMCPREPFHLLRADSVFNVRVDPLYHSIESRTSILDAEAATAWIDCKLSEARPSDPRYEPSLRDLLVVGSRVRLPGVLTNAPLSVSCYAGEIKVPVDCGWVTAPSVPPGVPDPVSVRITNFYGALRLVLEVFWSAWASEPEPVMPIRDGLLRLRDRGWGVDE
jgi:hypothetical protein